MCCICTPSSLYIYIILKYYKNLQKHIHHIIKTIKNQVRRSMKTYISSSISTLHICPTCADRMCTNTKLVFTDRVTFYCAMIFIFLNGQVEQFSDRMALKPKMDTVCTWLGFVGRGLPVFLMPSRCFPMPSRCLPDASQCLPDAFPTPYRCFPMLSRLLSNAFLMPS